MNRKNKKAFDLPKECAFDFSRDGLGQTVEKFVNAMAETRAHVGWANPETGLQDVLYGDLFGVQEAYVELFKELLECGVMGKEIALRMAQSEAARGKAAK